MHKEQPPRPGGAAERPGSHPSNARLQKGLEGKKKTDAKVLSTSNKIKSVMYFLLILCEPLESVLLDHLVLTLVDESLN